MVVHPQATAYEEVAEDYERGRPGYPSSLLEWIGARGRLTTASTIVDLGAGTGKLTRLLLESGARVIAVEPLAAMRSEFRRILPDGELLEATAEAIPLPDDSVDLVTCGQSFHWFANDTALDEIARVLHSGGELVLASNAYEDTTPLRRRLIEIRREAEAEAAEATPGENWRELVLARTDFDLIGEVVLHNEHVVDREGLLRRVRSSSPFARLAKARQEELLAGLDALIDSDSVELTQLTHVMALKRTELR